jgi:FG-GAP-like repeat
MVHRLSSPGRRGALAVRVVIVLALLLLLGAGGYWYAIRSSDSAQKTVLPAVPVADLSEQVYRFCGECHAYPPADTFPRSAWKEEVERGYNFFSRSSLSVTPPPIDQVIRYYEEQAPERLPPAKIERAPPNSLPLRFAPQSFAGPLGTAPPAISNVNLVHLSDPKRLDILACEMRWGHIMALKAYEPNPTWRILGKVTNPAHAEVVDLDGDGILDVIVADLGTFPPADRLCGSVVWLRGNSDGSFTPHTLLKDVGRVADVQAADFNGDGKLDLIVAIFGWQDTGEIMLLENQTTDWKQPVFVPHVIDKRHGGIHVPVTDSKGKFIDLNGDGKPDFVALIAQEFEEVCAFINEGNFRFRMEKLYTAPHPAYGSSGIQVVDLDGDGHVDVLYTNGDVLDAPHLLKPYHQVQWLRNRGNGKLDFEHRPIAPLYGAHRAVAADLRGEGRLDIVAVSYLPAEFFPQRQQMDLDAIIYLEQVKPGQFVRHTLASKACDHVTCAVGDVFGTGRADIVTGRFTQDETAKSLLVLKNLGRP